jgi:tRNA(Arg) A34 adenosine deaminase TadA
VLRRLPRSNDDRTTMTDTHPSPSSPSALPGRQAPQGDDPTREQMIRHLRRAGDVAERAVKFGHHPFGAILVAPDHETILIEQGNVDTVNHAESVLARTAATSFSEDYLWGCTLYTNVEPCCMCAGTVYWANIGRLVYGADERDLLAATGSHEENPTMSLPCRTVFEHSQKAIKVFGPFAELQKEIAQAQQAFWATR